MESYRELTVWQKSMLLVKETYLLCRLLPNEEMYALSSQMRRASISIPSNIAEGFGRGSRKDYTHFLAIAKGSAYELDTQIRAAIMLDFFEAEKAETALNLCEEICKMLNALIKKLNP